VKHGPRWFLVVLSSDFRCFFVVQISTAAATIPTVWRRHHSGFWLLVVQISTVVLLFRFPVVLFSIPRQQLVFFGAKQQFGKVKNIIFKCGKIIKKYIYIE
jgi:hypothetical protein